MSSVKTYGLTTIKMGAILPSGGMGTSLATIGYTQKDSAKLVQDDPEMIEHYAEETDDPILTIGQSGKIVLSFTLMDPDADALATVLGGSTTGTPKVWTPDATYTQVEKSIEITPQGGFGKIEIPRAHVIGKINAELAKKGLFVVDMKCTILTPTLAGLAKISITDPAS